MEMWSTLASLSFKSSQQLHAAPIQHSHRHPAAEHTRCPTSVLPAISNTDCWTEQFTHVASCYSPSLVASWLSLYTDEPHKHCHVSKLYIFSHFKCGRGTWRHAPHHCGQRCALDRGVGLGWGRGGDQGRQWGWRPTAHSVRRGSGRLNKRDGWSGRNT